MIDGGFGEEKTIHAATAGSSLRKMLSFTVSRTEWHGIQSVTCPPQTNSSNRCARFPRCPRVGSPCKAARSSGRGRTFNLFARPCRFFFTASMMPTPTIATVAIRSAISPSILCTTESSNRKVLNAKATQIPAHRSNITEMIYTGSVASATRTSSSAAGPMSPSMSAYRASRAGKFDKQVQHRADHRHLPTDCIQDCCAGCVHHCTPNNQPHQQL